MNTKIVQKCGCYEGDCVEILGLEVPLYACFTCGYAGVTPSGADNPHEDEVHVHDLLAEVKQKTQLADALWDFIEYFCPHLLSEATDCWNSNSGEYREIE